MTLHYGKALPLDQRNPNGSIPVYGANGVRDAADRYHAEGPSLIIGRKGSAGQITRVDGPFWPLDVTYFTSHDQSRLDFGFLHYLLNNLELPKLARGVKPGINRDEVYALHIPLPPIEEQRRIVAVLDEAFEGLDRARAHAEANLRDSQELFVNGVDSLLNRNCDGWRTGKLSELVGQVFTGPFGSLLHRSDYVEGKTPIVNPANRLCTWLRSREFATRC